MSKYFSNELGPTFYKVLGTICAAAPLPLFWVSYLCVKAGQFWPLILFAIVTTLLWLSAYYLFRTAMRSRP